MPMQDGKPQQHYFKNLDAMADQQIKTCLAFFKQQGLTFYNMNEAQMGDSQQGKQRYITISVSIKVS